MKAWLAAPPTLLLLALAGHVRAAPVEFYCNGPPIAVQPDDTRSRNRLQQSEQVFDLDVWLNADPQGGNSITVRPTQNGVCDIHLPVGAYFLQSVSWREAGADESDHKLYRALKIATNGGQNTNAAGVLIKTTDTADTGKVTIEFHLYFMYPETGF